MPHQITLTLSDEEYQKYLEGLAALQALNYDRAKILIIFNAPLGNSLPMVRVPLPEEFKAQQPEPPKQEVWQVRGIDFSSPKDYLEHSRFYKQATRQANAILRKAASGQEDTDG